MKYLGTFLSNNGDTSLVGPFNELFLDHFRNMFVSIGMCCRLDSPIKIVDINEEA